MLSLFLITPAAIQIHRKPRYLSQLINGSLINNDISGNRPGGVDRGRAHQTIPGRTKISYINGLNSFGGLKATNNVATLGLPVCTEQSFAKIVSSLKKPSSQNKKGGAFTSTCSTAIDEIFKIAAILPALVLVGVAVGFVLLRIEATVEEAE